MCWAEIPFSLLYVQGAVVYARDCPAEVAVQKSTRSEQWSHFFKIIWSNNVYELAPYSAAFNAMG